MGNYSNACSKKCQEGGIIYVVYTRSLGINCSDNYQINYVSVIVMSNLKPNLSIRFNVTVKLL